MGIKIVSSVIIVGLIVVAGWHIWKLKSNQQESTSSILTIVVPNVIAIVAIIMPLIPSGETLSIEYPNVEKYIKEIEKLEKENTDLTKLVTNQEKEQDTLTEKVDSLKKKNFADIQQMTLVKNGLKDSNLSYSIAEINGENYFNESVIENISETDWQYSPENHTLYLGKEADKVEKIQLEAVSNILYSGENYETFGLGNDDMDSYKIAGQEINTGFLLHRSAFAEKGSFVLFNLNDGYSKIEFDLGRIDEEYGTIEDGNLKITNDKQVIQQEKIDSEKPYQHYSFDVRGIKNLKIAMYDSGSEFGFYNVVLTK